jgi:hypothetical protein
MMQHRSAGAGDSQDVGSMARAEQIVNLAQQQVDVTGLGRIRSSSWTTILSPIRRVQDTGVRDIQIAMTTMNDFLAAMQHPAQSSAGRI